MESSSAGRVLGDGANRGLRCEHGHLSCHTATSAYALASLSPRIRAAADGILRSQYAARQLHDGPSRKTPRPERVAGAGRRWADSQCRAIEGMCMHSPAGFPAPGTFRTGHASISGQPPSAAGILPHSCPGSSRRRNTCILFQRECAFALTPSADNITDERYMFIGVDSCRPRGPGFDLLQLGLYTLVTYSPVRVSTRTVSPTFTN